MYFSAGNNWASSDQSAFGLVVMAMIYAVGHVSGAHFNPAVTLAFAASRHFPMRQIMPYVLAQCLGGIVAGFFLLMSLEPGRLSYPAPPGVKKRTAEHCLGQRHTRSTPGRCGSYRRKTDGWIQTKGAPMRP